MWAVFLPWTEYWYNTSFHGATWCTPFEVVYGRLPGKTWQPSRSNFQISTLRTRLFEGSNVRQENKDNKWRVYHRRKFKNKG